MKRNVARIARSRGRSDRGSSLILALIYVVAVSLVALALADWATNDLSNTTKFSNASQFDTALRSIVELGTQNIRYKPLNTTLSTTIPPQPGPVGLCWTPTSGSMDSQIVDGYSLAVWCQTTESTASIKSSATRLVTLYACPTTITTGTACAASFSVESLVTFDDYQSGVSAYLSQTCVPPNCGFGATQKSWIWGVSYPGGIPTPSSTIPYTVGAAAQLVFTSSPIASGEGVNFTTNPQVSVEDTNGHVVTTDSSTVTISITGYSAGSSGGTTQGTLSGCVQSGEVNGVVSFTGCSISGPAAAGTYTLSASESGLVAGTTTVTVSSGIASKLAFTTQPVAGVAEGTPFATNPQVSVEDANGNVVTSDSSAVSLAITGATSQVLNGCVKSGETSGVETFTACSVTGPAAVAGGPYTLSASETGLTGATSASFALVAGAASQLTFTTAPPASLTQTNGALGFAVSVADSYGNPVTSSHQTDSISVASPGMTGTTTVTASGGTATFANLKISSTGVHTITATDGSFTGTAKVTVLGFNTVGTTTTASNTSAVSQSLSGVGTTAGDAILILITYNSKSTTTPACTTPTGTAIASSPAITQLAAASQWSGTTSPYFGYCAYTADVGTAGGTISESMTGAASGTGNYDYIQMQVVEVTGDTAATFPTGGVATYGSPTTQVTSTRYYPGATTLPGDSEVLVAVGTSSTTSAPTFTEPSGFTQLVNSGAWGLTAAKVDVNVATGPLTSPYASGSVSPASTYGTYGFDLTP